MKELMTLSYELWKLEACTHASISLLQRFQLSTLNSQPSL
jgi:hypothetical protein